MRRNTSTKIALAALAMIQAATAFAATIVPPAPTYITDALSAGTADAGTQLVWHNDLLIDCTTMAISFKAGDREKFQNQKQKFNKGVCYQAMCMTRALALDFLAQSSPNPANGGSADPQTQATNYQAYINLMNQVSSTDCDQAGSNQQIVITP